MSDNVNPGTSITNNMDLTPTISSRSLDYGVGNDGNINGTQLTLFARNVFAELGCVQHEPTKVWSDNLSNILCIKNQSSTPRSRHIDLRFHFISEQVSRSAVGILHIPGDSNPADLLTPNRYHNHDFTFTVNALMRITTSGSKITSRQFADNQ